MAEKTHDELVCQLKEQAENATGAEKMLLDHLMEQHFASVRAIRNAVGLPRDTGIVMSAGVTEK